MVNKIKKGFKRGIDEKYQKKAQEFWESKIGKEIIACDNKNRKQFQVCIRDNYFNVYWQGCSVLKYTLNATVRTYMIHHKYVGVKTCNKSDPYVNIVKRSDDLIYLENNWSFRENILIPAQENGYISCVADYVGKVKGNNFKGEKKGLADYLNQEKPCWLDLEIAFSREKEPEKIKRRKTIADRIDLVRIVIEKDNIPTLQLVEVKLATDGRLKKKKGDPEIFYQMKRYKRDLIDKQKGNLLESYKKVAENMLDYNLIHNKANWVERFITEGRIDDQPYLLVLGDISGLKKGKWGDHWEKICQWDYPKPEEFPHTETNS